MGLIKLAWRNYSRHLQRYRVLLLALVLVVAVLVTVLGTVIGMSESLRQKASRYFSGNIAVQGFGDGEYSRIEHPEALEEIIRNLDVDIRAYSRRSLYYDTDSTLFSAGYYTRQRRLVGVEWQLERPILQSFDFVAGGLPQDGDREGILISTTAAESLNARVGDGIIVSATTDRGQSNTLNLIVRGIFAESSFFGYTAYMHRLTLNQLRNVDPATVTEMGIYIADYTREDATAAALLQAMETQFQTFPLISSREERSTMLDGSWDGRRYAVLTLDAQLAEITDLLEALTLIAGIVVLLFLGIVVVGVGNTYSMIVFERYKEIGTLRALGLQRHRTVALFLLESMFLGLMGIAIGFAVGFTVLHAIHSLADLSDFNWAALFLEQGRLQWGLSLPWAAAITLVALLSVVLGCLRSALAASRIPPVEALRE